MAETIRLELKSIPTKSYQNFLFSKALKGAFDDERNECYSSDG